MLWREEIGNRNRLVNNLAGRKFLTDIIPHSFVIRHSTNSTIFRQNNINITMNTANPPPSSGAAIACSILVILFSFLLVYQREHLRNAIRSRLARRELAKKLLLLSDGSVSSLSSSSKDGGGVEVVGRHDGPKVTGIFIHPGKR